MKVWMAYVAIFIGILLIAGCARLPDDKLIEKGKQLEEQGKFDDAIKTFRKVIKMRATDQLCAEAHYHIALIQANGLQDSELAVSTFDNLIEKYSETKFAPQAQFMIGFIYANNAIDTSRARMAYEKFISDYPTHELVPSVEWELKYLGKTIDEIPELMDLEIVDEEVVQK